MNIVKLMLLCLAACFGACGGLETSSEIASRGLETTAPYSAANGYASPAPPASKFCHPTYFAGVSAHAQAPLYTWGVPQWGGTAIHSHWDQTVSISAFPNAGYPTSGRQGLMAVTYECHDYADFHGGPGGQSGDYSLNWSPTPYLQYVSASAVLWDFFSACWIDSVGHLSATGESASLTLFQANNPSGWQWQLNVAGYPALLGSARCAWYGRNLSVAAWHNATPGAPSQAWGSYASGTCFIHRVEGNLDDGWVYFRHDLPGNAWRLDIGGGVTRAEGYCVTY